MTRILTVLSAMLFSATPALAQGDAAAGKAHYATCVACHGDNAQGNQTLNAPRLNHLEPVYVAAQLVKFRSGVRGGEGATASSRSQGDAILQAFIEHCAQWRRA